LIVVLALLAGFVSAQPVKHAMGWKPDKGGVKDKAFINNPRFSGTPIATRTDLRAKMPPVYNQGSVGSCTGQGCAAILDLAHVKSTPGAKFFNPSRLFIYYGAREIAGTTHIDNGAQIRDVISTVLNKGAPPENQWCPFPKTVSWPYIPSNVTVKPPSGAYKEALKYQALHSYKCQSLTDVRRALSMELPVVFGVPVYPDIEGLNKTNYTLKVPEPYARAIGGHAMVVVGHDDTKQTLIIRNSWGVEWGNKGHCLMPYAYWQKFSGSTDPWVIDNAE
jgi:C1A family cysteine protease